MATTSLWHISGRLTDVINYIENPEKTIATDDDLGELFDVIDKITDKIKDLSAERTKIYNKLRRAKPEDVPALKARRDDVSKRIEIQRKNLKCNHRIEERSTVIKDKLQTVYENELKHTLSDRDRSRAAEDRSER